MEDKEFYKRGWGMALETAIQVCEEEYRDSSQEDVARIIETLKQLREP